MPAGCGTWPAFWLTDEANWPVNGKQFVFRTPLPPPLQRKSLIVLALFYGEYTRRDRHRRGC
jgi:hypothetical protein